ncbi:MAG: response regulator [Chitinivibrionales bacterium]|nr:response regulator [Chitinivibrionales bacterium]
MRQNQRHTYCYYLQIIVITTFFGRRAMRKSLIIIVEDEIEIAMILRELLNAAGFQNILTYDVPLTALQHIQNGLKPAILISNFRMPGMNGVQLLDAVTHLNSAIEGIIITADPDLARAESTRYPILDKTNLTIGKRLIQLVRDRMPEVSLP